MDIKTARSLPAEVVAFDPEHPNELVDWISDNSTVGKAIAQGERLYVPTLTGTRLIEPGGLVVRDAVGDFAAYTPEEFAARYEAAK